MKGLCVLTPAIRRIRPGVREIAELHSGCIGSLVTLALVILLLPIQGVSALSPAPPQEPVGQGKVVIGVIDLAARNVDENEARSISERLRHYLSLEDIFNVVERNKMESIMAEMGFQLSGACTSSDECAIQVGKILGAQQMVAGSVDKVADIYALQVRIIDINTTQILFSAVKDVTGGMGVVLTTSTQEVARQLADAVRQQLGRAQQQAPPAAAQPQPETPRTPAREEPGPQMTGRPQFTRGLWIQTALGGGGLASSTTTETGIDLALSGSSTAFSIGVGRYLGSRAVVFVNVFSDVVSGPTMNVAGIDLDTPAEVTFGIAGAGVGMAWYLSPDKFYVSASLVMAGLSLDTSSMAGGEEAATDNGAGLNLGCGFDISLSRATSLGLATQLYVGSMQDPDNGPTWSSSRVGLYLTFTYRPVKLLP